MILEIHSSLNKSIYTLNINADIVVVNEEKDSEYHQSEIFQHVMQIDHIDKKYFHADTRRIPPLMFFQTKYKKLLIRSFDELSDKDIRAVVMQENDKLKFDRREFDFGLIPVQIGHLLIPKDPFEPEEGVVRHSLYALQIVDL